MRAFAPNNNQEIDIAQSSTFSELYNAINSYQLALKQQPVSEFGSEEWRINSIHYLDRIYKPRSTTAALCTKISRFFGLDFLRQSPDSFLNHIGKILPHLTQSEKTELIYQHFDIIISLCFKKKLSIDVVLNITIWDKYIIKSLLATIPCYFEFFHSHVIQASMRQLFLVIISPALEYIAKTGLLDLRDESPVILQQYLLDWSVLIEQMPKYHTQTTNVEILKVADTICVHLCSNVKFKQPPSHVTRLQNFLMNTTCRESLFALSEGCDDKHINDKSSLEINQLVENRSISLAKALIEVFTGTPQHRLHSPTGIAAKLNEISFIHFILRLYHKYGEHNCKSVEQLEQMITTALLTFINDLPEMDAKDLNAFCCLLDYMQTFCDDSAENHHATFLRNLARLERRLFAVTLMALDIEFQRNPNLSKKINLDKYREPSSTVSTTDEKAILFAPEIIHFIWLGKPIPEKYLRSILSLNAWISTQRQHGIKIILWCDKIMNIYRTLNLMGLCSLPKQILVKTFKDDLQPKMEMDDFYTSSKEAKSRLQRFKLFTELEAMGAYNYATVSDLYRLEILRQFGGCYCDTDTEFGLPIRATGTIREKLPFGFRVQISMRATAPIDPAGRINKAFHGIKSTGNDIIVAVPNCPFIENALVMALQCLRDMRKQSMHKYFWTTFRRISVRSNPSDSELEVNIPSMYDVKRCNRRFAWKYNKRELSISCGPGIVSKCMQQFIRTELDKIDADKNSIPIQAFRELFASVTVGSPNITAFGIRMKSRSDLNWLKSADNTQVRYRSRSYTA